MSAEFEKIVLQKLDSMEADIKELKQDVAELKQDVTVLKQDVTVLKQDVTVLKEDVAELKQDVTVLKQDVAGLKTNVTTLKKELKEVKEDVSVLKNEVFNVIKPTLEIINEKVDIMININTAKILDGQTRNYKEQIKMLRDYENKNALEHSRMNYEICKLKANA